MTDEPPVDDLVGEIQARVEQRRRDGEYPPELTDDLRQHFERVRGNRPVSDLEALRRQLDALDALASFSPDRIALESGMPGGERLHAAVAKIVSRQTQGILEQVQQFGDAVREALRTVLLELEDPHGHVHDDLLGQVDALHERVAQLERERDT